MAALIQSFKERDIKGLMSFFPKKGTWSIRPTQSETLVSGPALPPSRYSFADLQKGLRPGGKFIVIFFENDDAFREVFEATAFKPWLLKGARRFAPAENLWDAPVFVRWRKEGSRFVIDEIGIPES